jgi:hypothetical protein
MGNIDAELGADSQQRSPCNRISTDDADSLRRFCGAKLEGELNERKI